MHINIIFLLLFLTVSRIAEAQSYDSPSEILRFQDFMRECKLQAPTSSTAATSAELMNGYTSEWFYIAEEDKIAFNQSGQSKRTELRHLTNWTVEDGDRSLHGRLKFVKQTCDQVTVVQIHDDANAGDGPNKPLLRIYRHLAKSPANHLWAAIKTDDGGVNTSHIDLGPAPSGYFDWSVSLEEGYLIIDIDGVEKVKTDVSFWNYPSYWKAGVYLQNDGEATVYFDELYRGESETVLSIPENFSESINIYPNPANSFINIEIGSGLLDGTVQLMDTTGHIIQDIKIQNKKIRFQLPEISGLYLVRIRKDGFIKTFKVVKE